MGKTPITWLELINMKLSERKKAGKTASIRDVAPEAKAEWTKIKSGSHPTYIQGKAKTHARKHKKDKTQKVGKSEKQGNEHSDAEIKKILATLKLCGKCSKQLNKLSKKQNGGDSCTSKAYTGHQPQEQPENANITSQVVPDSASARVESSEAFSTLTKSASQNGGNCNSCSLTGGKKTKKSKKHTKKSRK
jgi:hypothetical protein